MSPRHALIVLIVFCAAAAPVSGQWNVGAKAGSGMASFSGSTLDRADWAWGFMGGVFAVHPLVEELSVQTEVFYVRKGADVTVTSGNMTDSGTQRIDYIEIPAMLRLDVRLVPAVSLHFAGGPSVAIAVRCSFEDEVGAMSGCSERRLGVHNLDAGMLAAAGFDLVLGGTALVLEGRYGFGLINIDSDVDYARTNHILGVVLGIAVPMGGLHTRSAAR